MLLGLASLCVFQFGSSLSFVGSTHHMLLTAVSKKELLPTGNSELELDSLLYYCTITRYFGRTWQQNKRSEVISDRPSQSDLSLFFSKPVRNKENGCSS